jgi:hypothetical protein
MYGRALVFRASVNPLTDNFLEWRLAGIVAGIALFKNRPVKVVKMCAARPACVVNVGIAIRGRKAIALKALAFADYASAAAGYFQRLSSLLFDIITIPAKSCLRARLAAPQA